MLPQGYLVYGQDPGFVRALPIDPQTLTPRGTARTLGDQVERGAGSGGIAFAAAKNGLLVFAPTGNEHALVWVTSEGRVTPLGLDRGAYRGPELSPDGKTIAVSANNETRRPDLWVIDVVRGTRSMIRTEALDPRWTPDGRRIAFNTVLGIALTSPDGRESEVLISPAEARELMHISSGPFPTGWSPDGRSLLAQNGPLETWRLKYPEKVLELFLKGPLESQATISPTAATSRS